MSQNLWPDFDVGKAPRSPSAVIREAGAGLEKKTNGYVIFYADNVQITGDIVDAPFSLFSRPLRYLFPFMRARFAVNSVYPVTIVAYKLPDVVARDENELLAALATIFKAPSTVDTIQSLMALAKQ